MSVFARTLAACATTGLVLYVGWLGWRDFLIAPPLPEAESAAHVKPRGAYAASDLASPSAAPVPPAAPSGQSSGQTSPGAPTVGAGMAPAEMANASSESNRDLTDASERAGPGHARGQEARLPDRTDAKTDHPTEDPEKSEDEPRSRSVLGGWVFDRDGHAVSGLPVEARPRRLFAGVDAGSSAALATELRAATDGAGRFSFARVPDGEYEVRTEENELYERATAALRAGVDSAVLVVEAKARMLHVHGVVTSTRGEPLKGVRVEALGGTEAARSDESGGYAVRLRASARDQDVALRFAREGYREQRASISAYEGAAGDVVRNVSLEPAGALAPVSGVVTGSDGPPVPRASVQLFSVRLARRYQTASGGDGSFAFPGVEESDDYRLWVRPLKDYRDHVRQGVEVGPQGASLDVVLDSVGTARLWGSMVDPEGHPVPSFTMWLNAASGRVARSLAVTGDTQGRFEARDIPEGAVTLETRAAPLLTVSGLQLTASAPREYLIPLDVGPHRLEGTLLDDGGTPVGGGRVSLLGLRNGGGLSSRSLRETVSDARGQFVFTQLGSGTSTLSVTATGFRGVRLQPQIGSLTAPLQIKLSAGP